MKLNLSPTDIQKKLLRSRNKRISEEKILQQVQDILKATENHNDVILESLKDGSSIDRNSFNFDHLESNRIFHISDIEKICVIYRLRFLSTKYFKGNIPHEAISEIRRLEQQHDTSLKGFKILAPSKLFKLKNADDPLLMAPMGNDYYYLIHKWGNDLSPFRKIFMWPFRTFENFAIVLIIGSFLLALLVPDGMFSPRQTTAEFFIIFFFMFKWVAGLAIFFGIKKGKNFSSEIWNSKYYNA
ncbi:hypothetical protein [Autumnicola psychrophila]|uniref:Uncharacterized protein n=1 Tax=Autumnicola psychrophila TaxID=3075592 RepID=A0ABU3DVJ8_9FLAO|nr:hypothetical protein [Zunongwangia sp. F225]MDT0687102.1 hypothetical protein [Zunongwangia sp. F225]